MIWTNDEANSGITGIDFNSPPKMAHIDDITKLITNKNVWYLIRGVESSTISSINFSILGSNKRFFDKLYDGSWSNSSIYIAKIT